MCYSVMVETDLKKLGLDFDAVFDLPHFTSLLTQRLQGTANLKIPRAFEANFIDPKNEAEKKAAALIREWQYLELKNLEDKLSQQSVKVLDITGKLQAKETKTNRLKLETAERVSARLVALITHLKGKIRPTDALVHQYTYAPLVVNESGRNVIRLYRYQIRPRWAVTELDRKINMFNARLDALTERKSWEPLFMNRHGAIVLKGFYEWVPSPESGKPTVINFFPKDRKPMWVPALHEHWEDPKGVAPIDSFAILTRDPPKEIETLGHDRSPIHPEWRFLNEWLNPKSCTKEYIYDELRKPSAFTFDHAWGVTNEGWDEESSPAG
jgi:putative SOS response-associated peptidase YedK